MASSSSAAPASASASAAVVAAEATAAAAAAADRALAAIADEELEELPHAEQEKDPLFGCRIEAVCEGEVVSIAVGETSKERVYRVHYTDGDNQDLTREQVLSFKVEPTLPRPPLERLVQERICQVQFNTAKLSEDRWKDRERLQSVAQVLGELLADGAAAPPERGEQQQEHDIFQKDAEIALAKFRNLSSTAQDRAAKLQADVRELMASSDAAFAEYLARDEPASREDQLAKNALQARCEAASGSALAAIRGVFEELEKPAAALTSLREDVSAASAAVEVAEQRWRTRVVGLRREASGAVATAADRVRDFVGHAAAAADREVGAKRKLYQDRIAALHEAETKFVKANESPSKNCDFARTLSELWDSKESLDELEAGPATASLRSLRRSALEVQERLREAGPAAEQLQIVPAPPPPPKRRRLWFWNE